MEPSLNIARIKDHYQAFCHGDFEAMGQMLADDAVWHVWGRRRTSGDKRGRDEILEFLRQVSSATSQNFQIEIHDILANRQHIVALVHVTSTRDGGTYRADEVHVFNVDLDGKIREAWGFTADPDGHGLFWF